jgi:DNA-binding transcriptional LysR family regulator
LNGGDADVTQRPQRTAAFSQRSASIDLNRISWDDLRLFVVAARHQSFRRAAAVLKMSSSTVTRRIERLEIDIGFRLFDRLPEGVALTREGHQVLGTAEKMEQASFALRAHLDRDLTTRGVIRCAVTEGLGTFWMLPRLVDFNNANPYTIVDLRCTMDFTDVARHEADIAIQLARPVKQDLVTAKLGRLHVYPFASRRYLDVFGVPQTAAELAQHRIVDQVSPQLNEGALPALLGLDSVEGIVAVRTNSSSAHFYAIELGVGAGFLPTYAVPLGADVVPLDLGLRHEVDIWLTYHPDAKHTPRVALFIDWVRETFDSRRYPWFRDEFIHPKEFVDWSPDRWRHVEPAQGVIAHARAVEPLPSARQA